MASTIETTNVLSLCSGGGGLDLGVKLALPAARTIAYVEREAFAVAELLRRMEEETLDAAPVFTDLRSFDGRWWRGVVDICVAGYPCQPFSLSGKRRGQDDPRHLWPHVRRVVDETESPIVFLENVPGHLSIGFDEVADDLEKMGYRVAASLFTAEEAGLPHKRERLFILAIFEMEHAHISRLEGRRTDPERSYERFSKPTSSSMDAAVVGDTSGFSQREPDDHGGSVPRQNARPNPSRSGLRYDQRPLFPPRPNQTQEWLDLLEREPSLAPAESDFRLLVDGVADDRQNWCRLLGNGVAPLQSAYAFCSLWATVTSE